MRQSIILLLTLLAYSPTLVNGEIRPFQTRESEVKRSLQEIEQSSSRIPQLKEQISRLNFEIKDLAAELKQLKLQRDRDIYDLKSGRYCSRCSRTPSQILKAEGETFEEHLKNVSGRSVPAPASRILKEEEKYARQIANLQSKYDQAIDKQTKARQELENTEEDLKDSEAEFRTIDATEKTTWAEYQQQVYQSIVSNESFVSGLDQTIHDLEAALDRTKKENETKETQPDSRNSIANQRNLRRNLETAKKLKHKSDSELKKTRDSFERESKTFHQRKIREADRYLAATGRNSAQLPRIAESPFESQQKRSETLATNTMTPSERSNMRRILKEHPLESLKVTDDNINFSQLMKDSATDSSIDIERIPSVEGAFSPKEETKSKSIFDSVTNHLNRAGYRATKLIDDAKNEIEKLKQTEAENRRKAKQKEQDQMLRDSSEKPVTVNQKSETYMEHFNRRLKKLKEKARNKLNQKVSDLIEPENSGAKDKKSPPISVGDTLDNFVKDPESEPPKELSDEK